MQEKKQVVGGGGKRGIGVILPSVKSASSRVIHI